MPNRCPIAFRIRSAIGGTVGERPNAVGLKALFEEPVEKLSLLIPAISDPGFEHSRLLLYAAAASALRRLHCMSDQKCGLGAFEGGIQWQAHFARGLSAAPGLRHTSSNMRIYMLQQIQHSEQQAVAFGSVRA